MISEKVRWTLRVRASSSGRLLDHVGHLADPRDQVGLLGDVVGRCDPLGALDQDPDRPVGHLQHPRDDAGHADVVELVGPGLLGLRVPGRDHHQHPVAGEHVVDQPHRALLADRQRRQRVRERHHLLQGQHRQRLRQGCSDARGSPARCRRLDDLEVAARTDLVDQRARSPPIASPGRSIATRVSIGTLRLVAARAQRQLDAQDAVLVGRLGLVGDRRRRRSSTMRRNGPAWISTCW